MRADSVHDTLAIETSTRRASLVYLSVMTTSLFGPLAPAVAAEPRTRPTGISPLPPRTTCERCCSAASRPFAIRAERTEGRARPRRARCPCRHPGDRGQPARGHLDPRAFRRGAAVDHEGRAHPQADPRTLPGDLTGTLLPPWLATLLVWPAADTPPAHSLDSRSTISRACRNGASVAAHLQRPAKECASSLSAQPAGRSRLRRAWLGRDGASSGSSTPCQILQSQSHR